MKLDITKEHAFSDIQKYLSPLRQFNEEKARKGMLDDWDEAKHTSDWIKRILKSIQDGGNDRLTVYYWEEKGSIIGVAFALINSESIRTTLAKDGVFPDVESPTLAHLTGFHILESHRGQGRGSSWLTTEILPDLRAKGVQQLYIRSSHYRALSLYEKLGTKVGNYISVSDSKLYKRYGYIYRIDL